MFLYVLLFLSAVNNHACFFNVPKEPVPSCSSIDISNEPENPLPSQEITVVAVCASQERGPTPCPTCTVKDSYTEYDLGKINTVTHGERCSTRFQIHVHEGENRTDLKITCRIGYETSTKTIVIEKSHNNGRCCNSADCMYTSQECVHDVCTCPNGTFFVETEQACYQKTPEETPEECKNVSISISNRFPLFSDVVSAVTSCNFDTKKCSKKSLYPALDFISPDLEIIPTRIVLYYIGTKCIRHVDFTFGNQYGNHSYSARDLNVTVLFGIPMEESYESIYVHTNNYKDHCRQDRDCKGLLQCYSDVCSCPHGYEYVPEVMDCFPIVSRLYGACVHSEQCSFRGSICRQGSCQCQPEFLWDIDSESCVYEGRSLGETCELDRHCKLRDDHSMCSKQECTCDAGWEERYGVCALTNISGTSSRLQIGWLDTIAMIAVSLMFGLWKF